MLFAWTSSQAQQIEWLTPRLIDLGRVQEGQVVKGNIRFINKDSASLSVFQVITSCGCTAAQPDKQQHAPGDTVKINYTLNTRSLGGVIRKPLTVYYDCGGQHSEKFILQADVYSELDIHPRYLQFRSNGVNPDTVTTQCFSIRNHSGSPVNITKIHINEDFVSVSPQSATIQQENEVQFQVRCRPKEHVRKMVYLMIETDSKTKPKISVPVYVDMKD